MLPSPNELVGRVFNNRYQLTACLSTRKTVSVYRATDLSTHMEIAVKVLHVGVSEADQITRKRFRREAHAMSLVDHPNVIKVFEIADADMGLTFFTMELLIGESLLDFLCRIGPLSLAQAVEIFTPVCQAIHAAHTVGLVHRDVKPGNVFLHRNGQTEAEEDSIGLVKVLDFGIAKPRWEFRSDNEEANVSGEGTIIGTPEYMSPEQCRGDDVTPQSDIYSLGVMLYRMLTGHAPFDGPPSAILMRHLVAEPPSLRMRRPNLPPIIETLTFRAMAKTPEARYLSALDFANAFTEAVSQTYTPDSDQIYRTVSPPEQHKDALASQTVVLSSTDLEPLSHDSNSGRVSIKQLLRQILPFNSTGETD